MSQKKTTSNTRTSPLSEKPRRRPRRANARVGGNQLVQHRELTGFKYSPPAGIPETNPRPWYRIVLSHTSPPGGFQIAHLVQYFICQVDTSTDSATASSQTVLFKDWSSQSGRGAKVELRLHKVEVWNLTGKAVSLTVWEPPPPGSVKDTYNQLGGWTDAGGTDAFPRVGYTYPLALQNVSFTVEYADESFPVITTTAGDQKDTILHRYHISWRAPGAITYTSVIPHSPPVIDLLSRISGVSNTVNRTAQATEKSTGKRFRTLKADIGNSTTLMLQESVKIKSVCEAIRDKIPPHSTIDDVLQHVIEEYDRCSVADTSHSDTD